MSSSALVLPPLKQVAIALRAATEVLAHELAVGSEESHPWDEFEWCVARAVVTMQGIAPLLADRPTPRSPESWDVFLSEQRNHVARRQLRISNLMVEIESAARNGNIAFLPLKGFALHSMGIYEAGDRPMADIDLFVRDDQVAAALRLLGGFGFQVTFKNWRHQLLEAPAGQFPAVRFGEHADNPIKIELHSRIAERLPIREIDITDLVAADALLPGLNDYRSPASLMAHLLLHAAGNMRARALRLIQLHDIALLSGRLSVQDWETLMSCSGLSMWWAAPPLILVSRYYPAAIPSAVLAGFEAQCSRLLLSIVRRQCLTDVSWSNLVVYAFPGIEWSRTPGEAMKFIINRVRPSREVREELRRFAEHEQGSSRIPWYGISQSQRILRWIFSRPPRVQTLQVVRAALEQAR